MFLGLRSGLLMTLPAPGKRFSRTGPPSAIGRNQRSVQNNKVNPATRILNQRIVPVLTALSENTYLSAIRAGMVSVVPLTIIGGFFIIVSYLPVSGWDKIVAPYLQLLQVPVTATFGLLAVFVCFAIGYDLGKQLKQEAIVSATIATVIFLMLQIQLKDLTFAMDGLGSKGLFTAVIIALVSVRVQKFLHGQRRRDQTAQKRSAGCV